ncbi:MAG: gliding motility-associated C-terminal domain-containing protein [Bacteroidetes bacterium]|nr:gliding motility-associated C-terminal domain-containing protein [Bacteroidota bacterium]
MHKKAALMIMSKLTYFIAWAFFGCLAFGQKDEVWLCPNKGQWQEEILFKTKVVGGETYLLKDGIGFNFYDVGAAHIHHNEKEKAVTSEESSARGHYIKLSFIGAKWQGAQINSNPSEFHSNFYLGAEPSKWKNFVKSYAKTELKSVYPGIDLVYSTENSGLKYEWIVAAGVDPSVLQFSLEGADKTSIDKNGRLVIAHSFGMIYESAPLAFQILDGEKRAVSCDFRIIEGKLSYSLGEYDKSMPLVIDPSLSFSTFSGSTADNWGSTATPGPGGTVYGGGVVFGSGLPVTTGAYDMTFNNAGSGTPNFDVSILKFNATGTNLLYCTYLGGTSNEFPSSMITTPSGELYVLGITSSINFPTNAGLSNSFAGGSNFTRYGLEFPNGSDIFVSRFNSNGTALLNSTYVGGNNNDGVNIGTLDYNLGDSFRGEINLDINGNVYVASSTSSSNFPIAGSPSAMNGPQSAIAFKLNSSLNTLAWSRYISGSNVDVGTSVEIAANGDVYVAGGTNSPNIALGSGGVQPVNAGGQGDGFVLRLNGNTGQTINGTYVGQTGYDQVYFVQLDPLNQVYVLGQTTTAYAITPGKYGVANSGLFMRQFTPNLMATNWTTMLGAGLDYIEISPTAFLVSNCYRIYLSGWGGQLNRSNGQASNSSTNGLPVTSDAYQSTTNGSNFYIAVLDAQATGLMYGTFFGSLTSSFNHVDGGTSRFDKNGNIYHAVCAACGGNPNGFTTTPGVWSTTNKSSNCNLAVFKFELGVIQALATVTEPLICDPDPVFFQNFTQNANVYEWDFGDGGTSGLQSPSHQYPGPGTYNVTLIVSDSNNCFLPDTTTLVVTIGDFSANLLSPPTSICKGDTYQLEASGGSSYEWSPGILLNDSTLANPMVLPLDTTTTFVVIVRDSCGVDTLSVTVTVFEENIEFPNDTSLCITYSANLEASGGVQYQWSPSTYLDDPNSPNPLCLPDTSITYTLLITTINGCQYADFVTVEVRFDLPVPIIEDSLVICWYDSLQVIVGGADIYSWNRPVVKDPDNDSIFYINGTFEGYYVCTFTNSCGSVQDSIYVDQVLPEVTLDGDPFVCLTDTAELFSTGAVSYNWMPDFGIIYLSIDTVLVSPRNSTDYSVIGTDQFGCLDTAFFRVELFPNTKVEATASSYFVGLGDQVQLFGEGSVPGGNYVWSPDFELSCTLCQTTIAEPNESFTYLVEFTDDNGCVSQDEVTIDYDPLVFLPNSFTPDRDQFNEVFKVYGINLADFTCEIYNRWGELIHTLTPSANAWDGTYKEKVVPDGVYTWKLKYTSKNNEVTNRVGFVTVLK